MPIGWAITVVVLCIAVLALAIVVLGLLRQISPVLERAAGSSADGPMGAGGPPAGSQLPRFVANSPDGEVSSEQLLGEPAVLLFLSAGCGPCQTLAAELAAADLGDLSGQLVVITSPAGQAELGLPASVRVLTEPGKEVTRALSVNATPVAIAVSPDGTVQSVSIANAIADLSELAAVAV